MWDEPAGLTMIESLACGTPVITTRSGGIPEYVGDGAVVLERVDNLPYEIANNIDSLLSDKELYYKYATKGLERVRSHFSSDGYVEMFVQAIL